MSSRNENLFEFINDWDLKQKYGRMQANLSSVREPVLILHAEDDPIVPHELGKVEWVDNRGFTIPYSN